MSKSTKIMIAILVVVGFITIGVIALSLIESSSNSVPAEVNSASAPF